MTAASTPLGGFRFPHPAFDLEVPDGFLASDSPVFLVGPEEGGFRANINVTVRPSPVPDAATYLELAKREILGHPGGEVVSAGVGERDGRPDARIVYRFKMEGRHQQSLDRYVIAGGLCYVLSYTALCATFERLRPAAERILDSFQLRANA